MIDQFSNNFLEFARTADLVRVLIVIIALGVIAGIAIAWKGLPILERLTNGIQQRIDQSNKSIDGTTEALNEIKNEVVKESRVNSANASAVAGVADTLSQVSAGQTDIAATMVKMNGSLEKFGENFGRSVELLGNIYDRIGAQSTQMDILITATGATRKTADATQEKVDIIQQSMAESAAALSDITKLLTEIKAQPSPVGNLEALINTAITEIRAVGKTITDAYAMPFDKSELPIEKEQEVLT